MRKNAGLNIILLLLFMHVTNSVSFGQQESQLNVPGFFKQLYQDNVNSYKDNKKESFKILCNDYDIDPENSINIDSFLKLNFFHELFTGAGVSDCLRGGILEIPYFWHWCEPNSNPRHSILKLPERIKLERIKPPERFKRYQTFADIDRVPSLYLGDLVSGKPKYFHPGCGEFYTFGWCSEREMAFCLLLSLYGYAGKISSDGIHVCSLFWVKFRKKDGTYISLIANVDNTFDSFSWQPAPEGISYGNWLKTSGNNNLEKWYNKKAKSSNEINRVKNIMVGTEASGRIEELVRKYLQK